MGEQPLAGQLWARSLELLNERPGHEEEPVSVAAVADQLLPVAEQHLNGASPLVLDDLADPPVT